MAEEWRDINGYEGLYQVSNFGRVRSILTDSHYRSKLLKPTIKRGGYMRLRLYKNKVGTWFYVHRLVADAFVPNINNKPCINHLDENPSNNYANNLEWCTHKENNNYGTHKERVSKGLTNHPLKSKIVYQYTRDKSVLLAMYLSAQEAWRQTGINRRHICECALGKLKQAGGYYWSYNELKEL